MAWIDDEARVEPVERNDTGFHPGRALYWLATMIAAISVIFVIADFFISWAQDAPTVRVVALIAAAIVWLIGLICRAVLP